jgi:hypothetical protein
MSALAGSAAEPPPTLPDNTSMHGKVLAGYQGWAAPTIEGTGLKWIHLGDGGRFEPGHCVIDLWPDVSDLPQDQRVPTAFKHADGSTAYVFSPADPKTVDRHFEWMRTYGIDGVFLQRFGGSVASPQINKHLQRVLDNVRAAAKNQGRLWAVMYDLSGLRRGRIASVVMPDWKRLVTEQHVRDDATYLRHNGKPVVTVWGIGFNDRRDYTLQECLELVRFLKSDPQVGGNTVMVGVPYYWREQNRDALKDPLLHQVIQESDVVSPWAVGRFGRPEQLAKIQTDVIEPDLRWCRDHKVDYLPVIFPGFSWHNLQKTRGRESPVDQIPRRGGQFLWSQAVAARRAGADMAYVAMFDEIDEGTAIFKLSTDPPVGASPFVHLDVPRSDHYLWLSGQIGRLMRNQIPPTDAIPTR